MVLFENLEPYGTLHAYKVSGDVLAKLIVPSHIVRSIQIIIHCYLEMTVKYVLVKPHHE